MFTGLIEEVGVLKSITPQATAVRLTIACSVILGDLRTGDSISVDGCCLTAETVSESGFSAFASPETLSRTSLIERRPGDGLNLERSLTLNTRLGGHMVSGHVDATGEFLSGKPAGDSWGVKVRIPPGIARQCVQKGSIAIDGISLTIADLAEDEVTVWIIPETWKRTTLSQRKPGQAVNLESDLIGKYVYRFLETHKDDDPKVQNERLRKLLEGGGWGTR